jgi:hypothetical protein
LSKRKMLMLSVQKIKARVLEDYKKPVTTAIIHQTDSNLEEIEKLRGKFDDVQDQILQQLSNITDVPERERLEAEWISHSDMLSSLYTNLKGKLNSIKSSVSEARSRESILNTSFSTTEQKSTSVKMQRIEIPKFNGDIRNFMDFKMLFKNLVHENPEYSNVQKLFYLKSSLIDKAQELIKDFGISESSFVEA